MPPSKLAITDILPLPNSSVKIPRLGFGVYQSPTSLCVASCLNALKAGYRHIDTAQFYANEKEVGEAVRQSELDRKDVFITTKVTSPGSSASKTYEKVNKSVTLIDGENGYVDLFLIHSPSSGSEGRKMLWQALEKLVEEGRAKSIGVSNFGVGHIEEMKKYAKIWPPHVNQIELHPFCQQKTIVEYCEKNGIVVEAYSPLVRNYKANDTTLVNMSKQYGKSTAQILIRYSLQKNWVPLPKSDNPSRIVENANVYDFEITKEDMSTLDGLDRGSRGAVVQAVRNN